MIAYPNKDDAMWRPTDELRVIPIEGVFESLGSITPMGPDLIRITTMQAHRTERLWIRVWAEKEWRPA